MYAYDKSGLYVAGGTYDGTNNSSGVYRMTSLKPAPKWEPLADLPLEISNGAGAILAGKFYVTCGSVKKEKLNSLWMLDIRKPGLKWSRGQPLPAAERMYPALIACGKHLYLLGGWTAEFTILKDAYRYNPQADEWEKLPDLPMQGYCWTGRAIDDTHMLITGKTDENDPEIYDGIWNLDTKDMSMEKIGRTIVPATTGALLEVGDKQWWLIGGEPDVKKNRTNVVSIIRLLKEG